MTQEEVKAVMEEVVSKLPKGVSKEEVDIAINKAFEGLKPEVTKEEFEQLKAAMIEQGKKLAEKTIEGKEQPKRLAEAIVAMFEEKGIKTYDDLKAQKDKEYEIKADNEITSAAQTGTIMRTQEISPVSFPRLRPTAFLGQPGIRVGVVESGKSVLLWTPAAYTSNAGYVGEFTAIADGNAASATEKTRKLAKLGARQIITQETLEDLPQFAQRVEAKLSETIKLKFDELIYAGAGNDSTKPTEIYGLKTAQMTAFDATKVDPVALPNVSDLADACATQAEIALYKTNTVWMNPKTANRLRRTKDSTGQYVINQLLTGELVMGGHKVISNTGIGATELVVGDISAIQIWIKRNFTVKFEDLPSLDAMAMYIYMRGQVLVEDEDIKGLIYVANIDTALQSIEAPLTEQGEGEA
jgi:HK97 family phage major capsid protein